jgi:hypothetical protein
VFRTIAEELDSPRKEEKKKGKRNKENAE